MKIKLSVQAIEAAVLLLQKYDINLRIISQAEKGSFNNGTLGRRVNFSAKVAKNLTAMLKRRKTVHELVKIKESIAPHAGGKFSKVEFLAPIDESVLSVEEEEISTIVSGLLVDIVKMANMCDLPGLTSGKEQEYEE